MHSPSLDQPREDHRSQKETRWRSQSVPWQTIFSCLLAAVTLCCGIWLRVLFFRSFPDPFPTPDTWSYLTGAFGLLQKGQFDLFAQRTPVFPLLVWITIVVFKSFAALNFVHGVLTLLSALGVAFVVRAFGGPWRLPAALAFGFLAVHPHLFYWEHFVMTEASFHAFFTLAVCAVALAALRTTPGYAAAAGLLTAIAVLVRPQGMFLTPLMLLTLSWAGRRLGRRKLLWVLLAAACGPLLLLGGWSVRNKAVHGFFGLSNIGPRQLIGVSARWIDLDSPMLAEDKTLISDSIRRYQSMPDDLVWVQYAPDGPGYLIDRKYASDPNRRDEVYTALALEAIVNHPLPFVRRGFLTSYDMVHYSWLEWPHPPEYPSVAHPWEFHTNVLWDQNWEKLASEFPVNQYRAALDETRFPPMSRAFIFGAYIRPFWYWETPFIRGSVITTLAVLLTLPLLSGRRRSAVALGAVSVILLILTAGFLSDVADQRYLSTIHGSAALAGALALTGLLERSLSLVKQLNPSQVWARRGRRQT